MKIRDGDAIVSFVCLLINPKTSCALSELA